MKNLMLALLLIVLTGASIFGQNSDEYNKNEFFVGYLNHQINDNGRETFNGFDVSFVRNVHRYFGVKADISGSYFRNDSVERRTFLKLDRSNYNVLGGIQMKNNLSKTRLQPFAHLLAGVGQTRLKRTCVTCFLPDLKVTETGLATAFGGGLDIKINKKISLRAIQADYNPIYAGGQVNHNFRLGFGVVFR